MMNVNNINDLIEVLSNLDCMEYEQIKIGKHTIDLFYDTDTDLVTMFDKCELTFDSLDELESYMIHEYQLKD